LNCGEQGWWACPVEDCELVMNLFFVNAEEREKYVEEHLKGHLVFTKEELEVSLHRQSHFEVIHFRLLGNEKE
jgi:type II secretory pathway component PulJ